LQAEYPVDVTRFQKSRDPGRAGQCIGVEVLRGCEWLVHDGLFLAATQANSDYQKYGLGVKELWEVRAR